VGIAVREGRAYVTGQTSSPDYPTTPGAFDTSLDGTQDVFITKLNASGSRLAYSTFLGGTNRDSGEGIVVDGTGSAYLTGFTESTDYPTTSGAFDTTYNGGIVDAFVTKFNASGSGLAYSTFLGGGDLESGQGIVVREGRAYLTGGTSSPDYPTTPGAYDTTFNGDIFEVDAFVTKLNASGSVLAYSTFLGGAANESGEGIAVREGRAYVTGLTESTDYPTTRGALDTTLDGDRAAFVTKFNASGSALAYSTFLGGSVFDEGRGIAVREGRAYVTGFTSSPDYPTTRSAFDRTFNGNGDAFVTKLPTA
jgi:hypothetical protein